jgi:molecular chaperone GrpE
MTDAEIEAVLGEFRQWLKGSAVSGQRSETFDVLALVNEFTALRHEVKLLTKATRARNEELSRFAPAGPAEPPADDVRPLLSAAVELVDVLDRSVEAANKPPARQGWWPFGRTPNDAGLAEGLRLARNRVTAALVRLGLEPVEAAGQPFDPETMEAIDVAAGTGQPGGTVVEVTRAGYRWRGKVFRYAQVRVAK